MVWDLFQRFQLSTTRLLYAQRGGLALRAVVAVIRYEPIATLVPNQVPQLMQQDQRPCLAAARGKAANPNIWKAWAGFPFIVTTSM